MLRRRMLVIGGIAIAMLVAGCNTGDNAASPEVPTVNGVAAPSSTPPPETVPEPESEPGSAPPPATPPAAEPTPSKPRPATNPNECKVGELELNLGGEGGGAAGTYYRELRFTNVGNRTCVMQGFPGVSYVAGEDGHQVGEAAYRDGKKGPAVTLKPSMTAEAPVGFAQVRNYDPAVCKLTEVRGLRVYPPHEYDSMYLPAPGHGCAGDIPGHQLIVRTIQ